MTISTSDLLLVERRDHTLLITIANPPANTWNSDNLNALKSVVELGNADREVYALVITGQGGKFFSAGADLNLFADGDKDVARAMAGNFGGAFETLAGFSGVSIAAINGTAMGGGLECALACDIRIAETHAQMALPEAAVGLLPCGGGTQNLAWTVGEGWAKRIILCGERIKPSGRRRSAWLKRWWNPVSPWTGPWRWRSPSDGRARRRCPLARA